MTTLEGLARETLGRIPVPSVFPTARAEAEKMHGFKLGEAEEPM